MDALYPIGLLIALAAGGLSVITAGAACLVIQREKAIRLLRLLALGAAVVSMATGLVSAIVHFIYGHGRHSAEPMGSAAFLLQHRAYWAVLILSALGLVASRALAPRTTE